MGFWGREIVGWLLTACSLYLFLLCLGELSERQVVQAGMLLALGMVLFRGGLALIKVATAARIVWAARQLPAAASQQKSRASAKGRPAA